MAAAYSWPHQPAPGPVEAPAFTEGTVDRSLGSRGSPWLVARALYDVARALAVEDLDGAQRLLERISLACGPRKAVRARRVTLRAVRRA